MTDDELLKLAAKAAGLELMHNWSHGYYLIVESETWNPLADDGDAFRLAVKLKISVDFNDDESVDIYYLPNNGTIRCWTQYFDKANAEEVVRRGITIIAAEIGKRTK